MRAELERLTGERDQLRGQARQLRAEEDSRRRDAEQRAAALSERVEAMAAEGAADGPGAAWAAMEIERLGAELEATRLAAARAGEAERERAALEARLRDVVRIVERGAARSAEMEQQVLRLRASIAAGGGDEHDRERLERMGEQVSGGLALVDVLERRSDELLVLKQS